MIYCAVRSKITWRELGTHTVDVLCHFTLAWFPAQKRIRTIILIYRLGHCITHIQPTKPSSHN